MKISVIIPTHNNWRLTNARLHELHQSCKNKIYEVILIDDASSEEFEHLKFWREAATWRTVFDRNVRNMGFGFSMNSGAARATGDIFVFLSNDVKVKASFTKEIRTAVKENPNILMGAELLKYNTGWNVIGGEVVPYLNGWFLACPKPVWELLGGFDHPIFGLSDYEDIDICLSAIENNIMLHELQNVKLKHLVAQSFGYTPERRERTERNKKAFIEKWEDKLKGELSEKVRAITGH